MDHSPKTERRDPADLRLHSLHKAHLPAPDREDPAWPSLVDNLSAAGPDGVPPLVITKEGLIMDGGRRWQAAKQLQWEEVRCEVQPTERAAAIIVESLLGQRDMTRGAKAYLITGLMPQYVEAANTRRLANLRPGGRSNRETDEKPLIFSKASDLSSRAEIIARIGVSRETWTRAEKVRELLHGEDCKAILEIYRSHPGAKVPPLSDLRALRADFLLELEPKLLNGEMSLWNVMSHIGGALPGIQPGREEGKNASQLELFTTGVESFASAAKFWNRFDEAKKEKALRAWREAVREMPDDLVEKMFGILKEASR